MHQGILGTLRLLVGAHELDRAFGYFIPPGRQMQRPSTCYENH